MESPRDDAAALQVGLALAAQHELRIKVVHRLRQPLTYLLGRLALLERYIEARDHDHSLDSLATLERGLWDLNAMIDSIMAEEPRVAPEFPPEQQLAAIAERPHCAAG